MQGLSSCASNAYGRSIAHPTLLTVPTIPAVAPFGKQAKANAEEKFDRKVLLSYLGLANL
ncbi:hypothetical protein QUA81_14990 [Microcoleus sp. F6_B4]